MVDTRRVEKIFRQFGSHFGRKILSSNETIVAKNLKGRKLILYLAKRFAAKEAVSKALGTGIGGAISFGDISLINDKSGKPEIILSGAGEKTLKSLLPDGMKPKIDISISDEDPYVLSFVVISAE